jgi:hypothetical protein
MEARMTSDSRIRSRTGKEMLRNVIEQTRPILGTKSKAPQAIGLNTPYSEYFLEGLTARLFTDAELEMLKAWNAEPPRKTAPLNSLFQEIHHGR